MTTMLRVVSTAVLSTALLVSGTNAASGGQRPHPGGSAAATEQRLRSDARDHVRVHKDSSGQVDFIGTTSRRGIPATSQAGSASAVAEDQVDRYRPLFGGASSTFTATSTHRSVTGGAVVRVTQRVAGVPVLGGQVVVTQNPDGDTTSMLAHTSHATAVPAAVAPLDRARLTAVTVTAKAHQLPATSLHATGGGQWVYDPAVVGAGSPSTGRVYRFEVSNGSTVRELVLVDAVSGRVALHFNQVAGDLDRVVCDGANVRNAATTCAVPAPIARTETGPVSAVADVNQAFDLTGATAAMYAEIGGLDLTSLMGLAGSDAVKHLASTVRFCDLAANDPTCPMKNAFWSGTQMFFGTGFAGADDVVGHEMTHGVIDQFSQLFYFDQSGAINESMADVMGEILDHRHVTGADATDSWQLGEDLPGGAIRSLADPTAFGQPDRMTSPSYTLDLGLNDNGGVHTDSGVGNKTAYLISQGGTFNGVTVAGIDAGDPTLNKTATLYFEVIKRLTMGSGYDDLARVLQQTCTDLATAGTAGFTSADCASVSAATQATELTVTGAGTVPDAPDSCPVNTTKRVLFADPDNGTGLSAHGVWTRAPAQGVPSNATSGTGSWFGRDPDPSAPVLDPVTSDLATTGTFAVPAGQRTYLRFNQWRFLDWAITPSVTYFDGGFVKLSVDPTATSQNLQDTATRPWVNGPGQPIEYRSGIRETGFGGDSRGWVGSRLDLSGLAGHKVRPIWRIIGDPTVSLVGWYLDDIEVYTCPPVPPSAPAIRTASGGLGRVVVGWSAPATAGAGVTGYEVALAGRAPVVVPATARSHTFTSVASSADSTVSVRARGVGAARSPATRITVKGVALTIRPSTTRLTATRRLSLSGRLGEVTSRVPLAARTVVLQSRRTGSATYSTLRTLTTRPDGTYAVTFTATRGRTYRAVYAGGVGLMGVLSRAVTVG